MSARPDPAVSERGPAERAYRLALRLYPGWFRARYGDAMMFLYRASMIRARARDAATAREWLALVADAVRGGLAERLGRDSLPRPHVSRTGCQIESRSPSVSTLMASLLSDLRFGVRGLVHNPTYAAVAILTLALGIGAAAAIFSVIDRTLIRPLSYPEPARLTIITETHPEQGVQRVSMPTFLDWRERARGAEVAAYEYWGLTYTGGDEPLDVTTILASGNLFDVLGAEPIEGRAFERRQESRGEDKVVLLGHRFWRDKLGSDPEVVGSTLELDLEPYTVVGIMPEGWKFPPSSSSFVPELYIPYAYDPAVVADPARRRSRRLGTVARLNPGVSIEAFRDEMAAVSAQIAEAMPEQMTGWRAQVSPAAELVVGDSRRSLLVLFGAVGFLLLIACANVANLMLARLSTRRQEIALRVALGAGRGHLVRQFLCESLLVSLLGGALGLGIAAVGIRSIQRLPSDYLPTLQQAGLQPPVILFTLALALLVGLGFGAVPAVRGARRGGDAALRVTPGTTDSRGSRRTLGALVVVEVALALVLLIGAGLLARSFSTLMNIDPGFDSSGLVTANIFLPQSKYGEDEMVRQFYAGVLQGVRAIPGVIAAGAVTQLPMNHLGIQFSLPMSNEAWDPPATGNPPRAFYRVATDGYFETMRTRLIAGRVFDGRDRSGSRRVMLINESLAAKYFGDQDPVGSSIDISIGGAHEVVGVVGDVRQSGLAAEIGPEMYIPFAQNPFGGMVVVARAAGDPAPVVAALKQAVYATDPVQPVAATGTMQQHIADTVVLPRLSMLLMVVFAGIAALLASVGIYGVLSFAVQQQRREIGVRMALGAGGNDTLRLVVTKGMTLVAIGLAVGIAAAIALGRSLSGMLYGVTALDPLVLGGVTAVFALIGLLACGIPAIRATRVDPVVALRSD